MRRRGKRAGTFQYLENYRLGTSPTAITCDRPQLGSPASHSIATDPTSPLFGGGTDNLAFLLGDPAATRPNAQTVEMTATFWIETVFHRFLSPPFIPGQPPLRIQPEISGHPVPTFTTAPAWPARWTSP